VKKGDTLGSIAKRNGTTVSAIKKANGLKSDMIHINQKISVPRH
jgi:LysM repeat protein